MYNFMDVETYDQIALDKEVVGDALKFVKENEVVEENYLLTKVTYFPLETASAVELAITETEPGFKGDTAQEEQPSRQQLRQVQLLWFRCLLRMEMF